MALLDVLDKQCIRVGLEGTDKEEVIEEMVDLLVRAGQVPDRVAALTCLHEREKMGTTGIGGGVAIPHGKTPTVPRLTAAVGIRGPGIEWEAVDHQPVQIVFLVLAEASNPGPHVQLLADVARLLKFPGLKRRLAEAANPEDVMKMLQETVG